jgi:hypothetical protein
MGKPVMLLLRNSFLQLPSNVPPCLLLVLLLAVVGSGRSAAALVVAVVAASSLRERHLMDSKKTCFPVVVLLLMVTPVPLVLISISPLQIIQRYILIPVREINTVSRISTVESRGFLGTCRMQ